MNEKIKRNIVKGVVFFAILLTVFLIIYLLKSYLNISSFTVTDVLLLLIIVLVVYLFLSGDISEFQWGSLSIKMKEIEKTNMEVNYDTFIQIDKEDIKFLYTKLIDILKKTPKKSFVLAIHRKKDNHISYGSATINKYLQIRFFEYVIFLDDNRFTAFIQAKKLMGLISVDYLRVENAINSWNLTDIPGILQETAIKPITISCLLNIFKNKKVNEIALTDDDNKFICIINKGQVISQITEKLIS